MKHFLIGLASVCLASCTVIEDRSVCPCWLKVSYDECIDMTGDIRYFIWDSASAISEGKEDISTGPHMYETPRGLVNYSASFNIPDDHVAGYSYMLENDTETAEFYAFWKCDIEMNDDYVELSVEPKKQFARFQVNFIEDISDRFQDMICEVSSSSAGVDLRSLDAIKGEYSYACGPNRQGQIYFKLSRQGFDDLSLTVYEGEDRLNTYSLSNILRDNNYDWTAPSLKDVTITLSLTRQEVYVELGDWEDGGSFEGGL